MTRTRITAIAIDCVFILLTLIFIFGNSFQNVEKSTEISKGVTAVVEKIPPVKEAIDKGTIKKASLHETIRSIAHAAEFALLGAEIMLLMLLLGVRSLWGALLTLCICLFFGSADEFVQFFNDRATEIEDVVKDFIGALLGTAFVLFANRIIFSAKKKRI